MLTVAAYAARTGRADRQVRAVARNRWNGPLGPARDGPATVRLRHAQHAGSTLTSCGILGDRDAVTPEPVDQDRIDEVLDELDEGWSGTTEALDREIDFADFPTAVQFVQDIVAVCEEHDHHPDLTISWRTVGIVLTTHEVEAVTELDLLLAREFDGIAAELPRADD
jgi:4a-hydroxytetrahydrobiopterin dehydratase